MRQVYLLFLALLFSALFGCSAQNLGVSNSNNSNSKTGCSDQTTMQARVQELNRQFTPMILKNASAKKFDEADFALANKITISSAQEKTVPRGTEMVTVVSAACAQKEQSVLWKLDRDYKLSELKDMANSDDCIIALSPNQQLNPTATFNDQYYTYLHHLPAINFENIYDKVFANVAPDSQTIVAVIDTGDNLQHPDMAGRYWINTKELNGTSGVDNDGNGFVDDIYGWDFPAKNGAMNPKFQIHHGEHVAGLIAANANNGVGVVGLAANRVKIMTLNVFPLLIPGTGQPSSLVYVEQALRYAADNGAKVVNLSLGNEGSSTTLKASVDYAVNKGVFIVAAAGNFTKEVSDNYQFIPAYYAKNNPGMIAVGATNANPATNKVYICGFSNFSSSFVEISAPGCDSSASASGLLSLERFGGDGVDPNFPYAYMEGTSMASPLIAAAAATAISYIKEKSGVAPSNALVKQILKNSSPSKVELADKIENNRALDMKAMITYIDKEILKISCP